MINYIKGKIVKKGVNSIVIDNNDIGYNVNTSLSTLNKLLEGEVASVYTYLYVREDLMMLYGFCTYEEIELFKKLISVNGIGPKAALSFLSTYEVNVLKMHIVKEDVKAISKVSGVGKKTAQKVILELKDKVDFVEELLEDSSVESCIVNANINSKYDDVINALISFGFTNVESKKVLDKINIEEKDEDEIIKEALKNINR